MRWSLGTWVNIAFIAAVIVVAGLGARLLFHAASNIADASAGSARARELLADVHAIELTLKEIEAGQNGFLISGNDEDLEPYLTASSQIDGMVSRLRSRVAGSARQTDQLDKFQRHINRRRLIAEKAIDARRVLTLPKGSEIVREAMQHNPAQAIMAEVRQVLDDWESDTRSQLRSHEQQGEYWSTAMRWIVIGGQAVALTLIGLAIFGLHRERVWRRRAEEQILEQHALLDQMRDAILVHDMEGRITYWNQGAEQLYRWKTAEVQGADADRLLCDPYGADHADARYITNKTGSWSGQVRHATKGGKDVFVEQRRTLIRDHYGRPQAQLVVNIDITDKLREEAQRRRSQRLESLGTLAGGVAHDLNNVLTPILVGVKLLRRDLAREQRDELLTTLLTSAERGAQIVRQLVSFAGGTQGAHATVRIDDVLGEVLDILRHTFPKTIDVRPRVAADLWNVLGDATELSQVLMNLCINARDAMPEGGVLTITADNFALDGVDTSAPPGLKHGFYMRLVVTDTGVGISEEVIDKIFDPFFTTKEKSKGTGLGLAMSLGIVHSHGGEIHVRSTEGEGTEFSVFLPPFSGELAKSKDDESGEAPEGQGETVLVVDDEAPIRSTVRRMLEAHGYHVVTADGGNEALNIWKQLPEPVFHVALVDMMMPDLDGPATIGELRGVDPDLPVVATSGLRAAEAAAAEAGANAFLPKPYTEEQLLRILRQVIEGGGTGVGEEEAGVRGRGSGVREEDAESRTAIAE